MREEEVGMVERLGSELRELWEEMVAAEPAPPPQQQQQQGGASSSEPSPSGEEEEENGGAIEVSEAESESELDVYMVARELGWGSIRDVSGPW